MFELFSFSEISPALQVKLEQGNQVLRIFKFHSSKTSVLDDFEFYEARETAMQEKKAKRQHYQKQARTSEVGFCFKI